MAYKQVLFRMDAREKILRGVTALADAVCVTLEPKSKCVTMKIGGADVASAPVRHRWLPRSRARPASIRIETRRRLES